MSHKMFQGKKGIELSLNTIVIAAIVIIILIVLTIVFTTRTGGFIKGLNECEEKGGSKSTSNQECIAANGVPIGYIYNPTTGKPTSDICCVKNN